MLLATMVTTELLPPVLGGLALAVAVAIVQQSAGQLFGWTPLAGATLLESPGLCDGCAAVATAR